MANHLNGTFFGLANPSEFARGLQRALNQIAGQDGIYAGDNLFAYHRNLSFLDDAPLMQAWTAHATTPVEQAILWRISTVAWAASNGLRLDGDFVECACYKGTTARIVCDALKFAEQIDRRYYLYDLFEHDPAMAHHAMPEHSARLYADTKARFADCPNVIVTQGKVPDILADVVPKKIAFMHLDLNNAEAEIGALEVVFDRMVPGAALVLDDYGWLAYRKQKLAEDPWFERRGYRVLEIPTGQGLVIK